MSLPIPFNNPYTYAGHSGVDFPQPRGTAFRASGPGRIGLRSSNSRGGNMVWVDYDGYPGVAYAHMDDYRDSPPVGTRVNEGDVIGRVGMSGHTTGPHLHVEVYGNATTAGFWKYFDRDRVVGSGSPVGGGSNPVPANSYSEEDMLIIEIMNDSSDGFVKKGQWYADSLSAPLTLLSAAEATGIQYWASKGIPFRLAQWDGSVARSVISIRGRRPFDANGRSDYSRVEY